MSESKDIHYLVVTPFTVISAEDGALLRPGSRCVVETEERRGRKHRDERGGQEMKSTSLYSTRCEGCGGVK